MKPEDRFVEKLRALLPPASGIRLGPGDDAAVVEWAGGLLAATTDMLVEGVDFLPGEDPERLGRRAVAVNLSDLAAMGAQPELFLLSIAFPGDERRGLPPRRRPRSDRAGRRVRGPPGGRGPVGGAARGWCRSRPGDGSRASR